MSSSAVFAAPRTTRAARMRRLRAWVQPQVSLGVREQRDQAVLLLAVAVATLPHFTHLQILSQLTLAGLWIWRASLAQTLKPAPSRIVVVALLVLLTTVVWIRHGTLWGRDASVDFLLVLMGLKILEMRARRDVFIIVILSLFVLETQFLFDQGPSTALVMLCAVLLLFFVLLSVSLPEGDVSVRGKVRYLARIFVLATPLTLVMFFLFPRLPAPLWSFSSGEPDSSTGLSDRMRPGGLHSLLRNEAVALRAKFQGEVPPQRSLYWRGPVFGYLDGDTWRPVPAAPPSSADTLDNGPGMPDIATNARSHVNYEVTLEPTHRRELLALEYAFSIDEVPTERGRLTDTLEVRTAAPVNELLRYRVLSYTDFAYGAKADPATLGAWLQLPLQSNPRTRRWAEELKARVAGGDSRSAEAGQRLVDALLLHFRRDSFRYNIETTNPADENGIDQFLFDTKVGYCEHYASSFVFLMRAMGVPARVVTGYQGGEINPIDGFLVVRQSDAHAWAEVWLAGRGWVRVDPTAAVDPSRVEHTLRDLPADQLAISRYAQPWLHRFRLDREALENLWNQWFLTYSAERQRALMGWIGLRPSTQNIAFVAIGAFALLLVALTVGSLRRPGRRDPLAEIVFRLRQRLARAGVVVPATMGLQDLARHLDGRLEPGSLADARALLHDLEQARYAPGAAFVRKSQIQALRSRLRRWRVVPTPRAAG
jgi:transglutaminase-like putative cysteine protease